MHELTDEQHLVFLNTVLPPLTREGVNLVRPEELTGQQEQFLEEFFSEPFIRLLPHWPSIRGIRFLI